MNPPKKQRWLTKEEAIYFGFDPKEPEKNRSQARYKLSEEEFNSLLRYRLEKRERVLVETQVKKDKNGNITSTIEKLQSEPINEVPEGFEIVKISTNKTTGQQWIQSKPVEEKNVFEVDFNYFKVLEKELKTINKHIYSKPKGKNIGVVTITDIHFGAYISDLNITPEYNITILCEKLKRAAKKINKLNYDVVELHVLGDLIESFTGLNHKNSWKGLQKGMYGVKAIKLFVQVFKECFLDLINNLNEIKIVSGNHDRVTSDKQEDTDGGAAELIAWGLENIGFKVEFNRAVITHKVNGINHILMHGHLLMTMKKTTQEICWMYGEKGVFNYIKVGHLHSRFKRLSAKQINSFQMVEEDSIDCRKENIASVFTGNSHSEDLGYTTLSGFSVCEYDEETKGVDVFDFSL